MEIEIILLSNLYNNVSDVACMDYILSSLPTDQAKALETGTRIVHFNVELVVIQVILCPNAMNI